MKTKTVKLSWGTVTSIYEPDPERMLEALRYCAERGALRRMQREQAALVAQEDVTADQSEAAMPEPVAKG